MSERKAEATAYLDTDTSAALDVVRQITGETRVEFVSRAVMEAVWSEVGKARMIAGQLEGKRMPSNLSESCRIVRRDAE